MVEWLHQRRHSRGGMLCRGAAMVYDYFQAYGPGIMIIVSACERYTDAWHIINAIIIIIIIIIII